MLREFIMSPISKRNRTTLEKNVLSDQQIIASWKNNVSPWIKAIEENQIESRTRVTNNAIVNAVLSTDANSVLDLGCGEGWLARALVKTGIDVLGVDVIADFIEYAKQQGGGRFRCLPYEHLSYKELKEKFDALVCNFSLLGNESVEHVFQQAPGLLNNDGFLIVQTLHPLSDCEKNKYKDGWQTGSWDGFKGEFFDPAPWYFRTLETWQTLFLQQEFKLQAILEPLNPKTKVPASILFIGKKTS